jgi:hypothetical protein
MNQSIVTLADYMVHMGTTTVSDSARVTEAIRQAIGYAETYCSRRFTVKPQQHQWTFSGTNGYKLFTPQAPIQSVDTVEEWNGTGWEALDSVSYSPYIGGGEYIAFREQYRWGKGTDNWRVTYTYGFAAVPADLKRAILMIAQGYSRVSSVPPDVKSQSDAEQSITYRDMTDAVTVPGEAKAILDMYRRLY